jgi:hypothetical protein
VKKQDCRVADAPRNDMPGKHPLRSMRVLLFHRSSTVDPKAFILQVPLEASFETSGRFLSISLANNSVRVEPLHGIQAHDPFFPRQY